MLCYVMLRLCWASSLRLIGCQQQRRHILPSPGIITKLLMSSYMESHIRHEIYAIYRILISTAFTRLATFLKPGKLSDML